MSRKIKTVIIYATIALIGLGLTTCDEWFEEEKSVEEVAKEHGENIQEVSATLADFVVKRDAFINCTFDVKKIEEVRKIFNDYFTTGEKFCDTYVEMCEYQIENREVFSLFDSRANGVVSETRSTIGDLTCQVIDAVSQNPTSLGLGTVKETGESIKAAREDVKKIQQKYDEKVKKGEMTRDDANVEEIIELRNVQAEHVKKAVNNGFATVVGGGAALITGGAITAAGVTGLAVFAVPAAVGAGATWLCMKMFNKKGTKSGDSESSIWLATGKIKHGEPLPLNVIPEGSTISFYVSGYAPVTIDNFSLPKDGMEREITLNPVKSSELSKGTKAEYCYRDKKIEVKSCDDVWYVNGSHSPQNPGIGVAVTVTATLMPPAEGCDISFSIIGTDGYSNQQTKKSNAEGKATFYIPGAKKGVVDKVTITSSNGKKQIVTYTFGL